MPSAPADSQVILVTGANKGIGYEAVALLARQLPGATVLLGCRSVDNGQKAIAKMKEDKQDGHTFDNVKVLELEVTKKASIEAAAAHVKAEYGRLDVLLCNAGVSGGHGESAEMVFAVNIDGVHDCIEAFLPLIPSSTGLIVVVTSEVGSWCANALPPALQQTLNSPSTTTWPVIQQLEADWLKANKGEAHVQPWPSTKKAMTGPYTSSKALVTAYLRSFALQHTQPKLVIVCPGYCSTDLNHNQGTRPASKGGESVTWPILNADEAESGQFYQDGHKHPFIMQAPEWAEKGFAKYDEQTEKKAKEQPQ